MTDRQPDPDIYRGIQSALNRSDSDESSFDHYNPLAGARPDSRTARLARRLGALMMYLLLVVAIVWLASRLWPSYGPLSLFGGSGSEPAAETSVPAGVSQSGDTARPARPAPEPDRDDSNGASNTAAQAQTDTTATEPEPADGEPVRVPLLTRPDRATPEPSAEPETGEPTARVEPLADTRTGDPAVGETETSTPERTDASPQSSPQQQPDDSPAEDNPPPETSRTADSSEDTATSGAGSTPTGARAETDPSATRRTEPEAAETRSGQTASFTPSERDALIERANNRFNRGDREQALEMLESRLQNDDHTQVRQAYARLLLRSGQPDAARRTARPDADVAELELRAYAEYQVGAYEESVRFYRRLLERAPTVRAEWHLWLAIGHDNLGETETARNFYRQYLREGERQPDELLTYARDRLNRLTP